MNEYIVKRLPKGEGLPELNGELSGAWAQCPVAEIGNYIWDQNGYKPRAEARVMYDERGLHVHMRAWENEVRAVAGLSPDGYDGVQALLPACLAEGGRFFAS